ncbi:MAG TPA: sodium:solute symporter family protein [Clostridia bacterium]|nr:sodium:solute symporter family protein [Clostridia bacterium]
MNLVDIIILAAYLLFMLWIGAKTFHTVDDLEEFALAGRNLSMPVFFGTLAATIIGGWCSVGYASYAYQYGILVWIADVGFVIFLFILGRYVVGPMRQSGDMTTGDLFGRAYGRLGRLLVSVLGLALLTGMMGTQCVAAGNIITAFTGLPLVYGAVISMGVVILYTAMGALRAVVYTDLVQFGILYVGLPLAALIGISKIGFAKVIAAVPPTHWHPLGGWAPMAAISFIVGATFGEQLVPSYTQRYYAAKDEKVAERGTMAVSVFYIFAMLVSLSLGFFARTIDPNLSNPDLALPVIIKKLLPVGLSGLVVAAVAAAIMSTADSALASAATIVVRDIYQTFVNPSAPMKNVVLLGRITIVLIGVGAVGFSLAVPKVVESLMYAYSFWVPTIVPPLILAVVWKKGTPYAGIAGILAGGIVTAVWTFVLHEPGGVLGLLPGSIANIIVYFLVHFVTKNLEPSGLFRPDIVQDTTNPKSSL